MQPREYPVKLVMVGDTGVGKSNLLSRFVDDAFTASSLTTQSMDFKNKNIEVNEEKIKLQIWDVPNQRGGIGATLTDSHLRGAAGVILVYDTTDYNSFENIKNWLREARQHQPKDCKFILVGTKSDLLAQRQVESDTAQAFAEREGISFYETSAKNNKNNNINQPFQDLAKEIRKPFAALAAASVAPAAAPVEVKKPKDVKKEIKIDVSNVDRLKDLIMGITKGEKNEELKQLGKTENLKEAVLNYLEELEKKHSYKDLDDILSKNQTTRKLNEFFKVPRGLVSLSLFGGTIKQFEALEKRWLERKKLGIAKDIPIRHVPQQPSAPSGFYDDSGVVGAPQPSAPYAAPSAPYAPSAPAPSAPSAPRWPDAKSHASSAPQSTESFNERTKSYLNGLSGKPTVAERIAELKLNKDEERAFKRFIDPITEDYIKTPISLHGEALSLETLLEQRQSGSYTHPTLIAPYKMEDVEPGRQLLRELDEAIIDLNEDRANKLSPRRPK